MDTAGVVASARPAFECLVRTAADLAALTKLRRTVHPARMHTLVARLRRLSPQAMRSTETVAYKKKAV